MNIEKLEFMEALRVPLGLIVLPFSFISVFINSLIVFLIVGLCLASYIGLLYLLDCGWYEEKYDQELKKIKKDSKYYRKFTKLLKDCDNE